MLAGRTTLNAVIVLSVMDGWSGPKPAPVVAIDSQQTKESQNHASASSASSDHGSSRVCDAQLKLTVMLRGSTLERSKSPRIKQLGPPQVSQIRNSSGSACSQPAGYQLVANLAAQRGVPQKLPDHIIDCIGTAVGFADAVVVEQFEHVTRHGVHAGA